MAFACADGDVTALRPAPATSAGSWLGGGQSGSTNGSGRQAWTGSCHGTGAVIGAAATRYFREESVAHQLSKRDQIHGDGDQLRFNSSQGPLPPLNGQISESRGG